MASVARAQVVVESEHCEGQLLRVVEEGYGGRGNEVDEQQVGQVDGVDRKVIVRDGSQRRVGVVRTWVLVACCRWGRRGDGAALQWWVGVVGAVAVRVAVARRVQRLPSRQAKRWCRPC